MAKKKRVDLIKLVREQRGMLQINFESDALGEVEADLYEELFIDSFSHADEHMKTLPARMAYWGLLHRIAESEHEQLKESWDTWYAPLYEKGYDELWSELDYKSSAKPNINSVENWVRSNHTEEFQSKKEEIRQAKLRVSILSDVIQWWNAKMQMLIQIVKKDTGEMRALGVSKFSEPEVDYGSEKDVPF